MKNLVQYVKTLDPAFLAILEPLCKWAAESLAQGQDWDGITASERENFGTRERFLLACALVRSFKSADDEWKHHESPEKGDHLYLVRDIVLPDHDDGATPRNRYAGEGCEVLSAHEGDPDSADEPYARVAWHAFEETSTVALADLTTRRVPSPGDVYSDDDDMVPAVGAHGEYVR